MADRQMLGSARVLERTDFRCGECGYQIVTGGSPPACPMCRGRRWELVRRQPAEDQVAVP